MEDINNTEIVEITFASETGATDATEARTSERGLVSKLDVGAGDVIARISRPYLVIVENNALARVCSECLVDTEFTKLLKCGRCKTVWYCGPECQAAAWKPVHRRECPVYKHHQPKILPSPARALLQILLNHEHGPALDPAWSDLLPHLEDLRKQTRRSEDIELQVTAILEYMKSPPENANMALGLMCRMVTNAFRVTLPDDTPIGLCFEPTLMSLANHSCSPNAAVIFDGKKMSLRALNPIKQGEQIFISYVDTTQRKEMRQNELSNRYFFDCICEKCSTSDSPYRGFQKVPVEGSRKLDLLFDLESLKATAAARINDEDTGAFPGYTFEQASALKTEFVTAMRKAPSGDVKARLFCVRGALHKLTPLRTSNYFALQPYPSFIHEAYLCYVETGNFVPALILELFELLNCDVFNDAQPHHPMRVTRLFIVARLLKAIAQADNITLLAEGVDFVPTAVVCDIDYISATQATLILVEECAVTIHGPESRFVAQIRDELKQTEEVQKLRGDVGQILTGWQLGTDDEAVVKGTVIVKKLFGQLVELSGYALELIDKKSL